MVMVVVVVKCLQPSWRKESADTQVALDNIAYELHQYIQGILCCHVPAINRHPPRSMTVPLTVVRLGWYLRVCATVFHLCAESATGGTSVFVKRCYVQVCADLCTKVCANHGCECRDSERAINADSGINGSGGGGSMVMLVVVAVQWWWWGLSGYGCGGN